VKEKSHAFLTSALVGVVNVRIVSLYCQRKSFWLPTGQNTLGAATASLDAEERQKVSSSAHQSLPLARLFTG
jgi:hypothetical protein